MGFISSTREAQALEVITNQQADWRRSSYCSTGACVEIAQVSGQFMLRDSKNPDTTPFVFSREEWATFIQGVRAGEFDAS